MKYPILTLFMIKTEWYNFISPQKRRVLVFFGVNAQNDHFKHQIINIIL